MGWGDRYKDDFNAYTILLRQKAAQVLWGDRVMILYFHWRVSKLKFCSFLNPGSIFYLTSWIYLFRCWLMHGHSSQFCLYSGIFLSKATLKESQESLEISAPVCKDAHEPLMWNWKKKSTSIWVMGWLNIL